MCADATSWGSWASSLAGKRQSTDAAEQPAKLPRLLQSQQPLPVGPVSRPPVTAAPASGDIERPGLIRPATVQGLWYSSTGEQYEVLGEQLRDAAKVAIGVLRKMAGDVVVWKHKNDSHEGKLYLDESEGEMIRWLDGTCWSRRRKGFLAQACAPNVVKPAVQPNEPSEMFGYSLLVSRSLLNQYLQKRGLPTMITAQPAIGSGPFQASLEIALPARFGGRVLSQQCTAAKKQDAVNQVAQKMCIELCKVGEMAPFRSKAQVMSQGLLPCLPGIRSTAREKMVAFTTGMVPQLQQLGIELTAGAPDSLQKDFDAAPWATHPEAREISWAPVQWGRSPWEGGWSVNLPRDEISAGSELYKEQEAREMNLEYGGMRAHRSSLPIAYVEEQILKAVEASPVVLISGSTGCGKTTQVPQLLLERAMKLGQATQVNIVCTQPRRIAAITAAERVAAERGETLGNSVGYLVRFSQVLPRGYASICFMTTGLLLRRMASHSLRGVSHVIIDEVHERDLDTDFLLTILRQLALVSPGMKLILMSATIDLAKWSWYFGSDRVGAAIEIPGRLHPIGIQYLEDAIRLTGVTLEPRLQTLDADIPYDLLECLVEHLVLESARTDRGALLIFLPGWDSITTLLGRLKRRPVLMGRTQLHSLHSQVPREEQQAAFPPAPPPLVKVILATNIAETSITISDVVYVIDSCRVKQLVAAQSAGGRMSYRLTNLAASKQNLTQRAGRAGRVREGICYRLCSQVAFENLSDSLPPEMVRLPLHQVTLLLKSLNLGDAGPFLASAPDPPPAMAVTRALNVLQDIKALDSCERITYLGLLLAKLPIEPRMGFALLAACMMGLGEPMSVLCNFVGYPSPYLSEHRRKLQADHNSASQKLLSDHHDLLMTYYNVKEYPHTQLESVCRQLFLDYKVLRQVSEATDQTIGILTQIGLTESAGMASCRGWISMLGTVKEDPSHRRAWEMLTFLIGIGTEHFALRQDGRKVWLNAQRSSSVSASAAIPEVPAWDGLHPFFLVSELRENDWSSSCKGVTAASPVATMLGAARDLKYEENRCCATIDGWAPVQMDQETARSLGLMQTSLKICMLQFASNPAASSSDPLIQAFTDVIAQLCDPGAPEDCKSPADDVVLIDEAAPG